MNMEFHDQMQYVPADYPEVSALRNQGCPAVKPRHKRVDYTREHFCRKWGDNRIDVSQIRNCERPNHYRRVGNEINSFDYFSSLPIRREGVYPGTLIPFTLGQKMGLVFSDNTPKRQLGFSATCPYGTVLKPDTFTGDTICGTCAPNPPNSSTKEPFVCDDFPGFNISPNLPFRVYMAPNPVAEKIKLRTGAERCLQPSKYRDITSVYREGFIDFMKIKTPQQLSLYRSPLVIDHRRPRPKLPENFSGDSGMVIGVNNEPISINARPIQWKTKGPQRRCVPERPDYQICLPGPITLP